ncbi:Tll0287-like domain-containing protein [Thermosulfuriphilus sp.]
MKSLWNLILVVLLVSGLSGKAWSSVCDSIPKEKAEQIARYIADVIVAGRGIVAQHQEIINDPKRADKGFSPEYVEGLLRQKFKEMTGQEISDLDPEARAVVEEVIKAAKMSVQMNQKRINQPGKGFKGYIPAVFGRETGQILKGRCNIIIKQTTFRYRNAYNQPDPFEKKILKKFEAPDWPQGKGYGEFINGRYRYLRPIYIKKACLKCHGEPAGSRDIAGRIKEGYKEGDLRGAISVSFPVR